MIQKENIGLFWAAVKTLAIGSETLRERLANAYHHDLSKIDPESLPKGLRSEFLAVQKQLSIGTLSSLRDDETEHVARQIFDMFEMLANSNEDEYD